MSKDKKTIKIVNLIDWSRSFVDENGSFYCGTTVEQKRNAARIVEKGDLVIYSADLHPITAPEHTINGGLYPVHNAVKPWQYGPDFIYNITPAGEKLPLGDKTLSPQLTSILYESASAGRQTGMLVPREVYFQADGGSPFCWPKDIEDTFDAKIVTSEDLLYGDYAFIIAPKQYFDATRLDSEIVLPPARMPGIPDQNFNVFSLLKKKFPADGYELVFINTGVVEGICRLHTSIGLRQMFPVDRIINISDATTPLYGVGLGYETAEQSRVASMRVCRDIGIEYRTTEECLEEFFPIST